ncbi:nucleotidyltransferase [Flavobacterium sp. SUN052]|uniref:nucleotidyltransferase n=1 Tax=Flavobacterium sp. SUN052 TaxID=3002441 RepID=UPI00237E304E|nr:nucleotidyltransferase [Flavobacterium sp. SUN052]MEC4004991.1 nucleotidyltransferase [Flavobacterium sp. SUN052]
MNSQIIEIWKHFFLHKVKYLTIGGFAVNIYGYGRNTGDIDIFIEDSIEKRENLRIALKELGIGDFKNLNTMQFIPGWTDITLNFNLRLDIMTSVKGLENSTFDDLLEKAYVAEINDIPVYFIDYENLIIAKKATNSPKDILDIAELEKINKKSNSEN